MVLRSLLYEFHTPPSGLSSKPLELTGAFQITVNLNISLNIRVKSKWVDA